MVAGLAGQQGMVGMTCDAESSFGNGSFSDGVIPKPRVFTSGARDLPQNASSG